MPKTAVVKNVLESDFDKWDKENTNCVVSYATTKIDDVEKKIEIKLLNGDKIIFYVISNDIFEDEYRDFHIF